MCDLLHAAPFQNILPRVYIKGTDHRWISLHFTYSVPENSPFGSLGRLKWDGGWRGWGGGWRGVYCNFMNQSAMLCVSHRGRASGGEDEEAGGQVRSSPPCSSH